MTEWPTELGQGLVLLAIGTIGSLLAQSTGLPAGVVIGAMLTSGLYRLAGGEIGPWRGRYGQVGRLLLGTVIGAAFGPDVLAPLKAALLPMGILVVIIVGTGLTLGWILTRFTRLNIATALISVVPGGLPAMIAMSEEMDADATIVAVLHLARLLTILIIVPALLPFLAAGSPTTIAIVPPAATAGFWRTILALLLGGGSALLAVRAKVPTGDLIGPILVVGGANLIGAKLGPLNGDLCQIAMILIGTAVGAQMSRQSFRRLGQVAFPAAIAIATLIAIGLTLGWGLAQVTPLDLTTALLSSVPGGASTMPAIAHDLGADMRLVAALHLMRQLVIFVLVPSLLSYLLRGRHHKRTAVPKTCQQ